MIRTKWLGAAVLAMAAVLTGCNLQSTESDLVTLENFTVGSEIRRNDCTGETDRSLFPPVGIAEDLDEATRDRLRMRVTRSLSAVPSFALKYFNDLTGKIKVTADATAICNEALAQTDTAFQQPAGRPLVGACYLVVFDDAGKQEDLTLYIAPDEEVIKGHLVRTFGYFVAQYVSRLTKSETGYSYHAELAEPIRRVRSSLARTYLKELVTEEMWSASLLDGILGAGGGQELERAIKNTEPDIYKNITFNLNPRAEQFDQFHAERAAGFEDFIFAESFDSWFCSSFDYAAKSADPDDDRMQYATTTADSRAAFATLFPRTADRFEILIDVFVGEVRSAFSLTQDNGDLINFTPSNSTPSNSTPSTPTPSAPTPSAPQPASQPVTVQPSTPSPQPITDNLPTVDLTIQPGPPGGDPLLIDATGDPVNLNVDVVGFPQNTATDTTPSPTSPQLIEPPATGQPTQTPQTPSNVVGVGGGGQPPATGNTPTQAPVSPSAPVSQPVNPGCQGWFQHGASLAMQVVNYFW